MEYKMNEEITGKAKGGIARANSLSEDRRKEIGRNAAFAKKHLSNLPRASHRGEIKIGEMTLSCCVLEDGRRLISENAINSNLGSSGGKTYKLRDAASNDISGGPLPLFLASKALTPYINQVFSGMDLSAIEYNDNGKISLGFDAIILPKVCEVWLLASENKKLQPSQYSRAKKAEILIRGLARVGIVALVDEATGYQKDREKDALAKILEAFVAKELQPYLKTFPAEYYENLFRIYNLPFPPSKAQFRPPFFGKITNDVIYERLAPELLPELKKNATKLEKKTHYHRWLTGEVGHPKLREHLASITTLLKISRTPDEFKRLVNKVHPKFGDNKELDFDGENS